MISFCIYRKDSGEVLLEGQVVPSYKIKLLSHVTIINSGDETSETKHGTEAVDAKELGWRGGRACFPGFSLRAV